MPSSYEQATKAVREKLRKAEQALDAYIEVKKCDPETLKRLSDAESAARREVVELLSRLWPESPAKSTHSGC